MERRGGRRDRRGDGAMCEGIVPLGDDGIGKAKGFGKVFVCHPIPSHGEFGKNERDGGEPLFAMSVTN